MKKKIVSVLLAAMIVVTFMPTMAFATGGSYSLVDANTWASNLFSGGSGANITAQGGGTLFKDATYKVNGTTYSPILALTTDDNTLDGSQMTMDGQTSVVSLLNGLASPYEYYASSEPSGRSTLSYVEIETDALSDELTFNYAFCSSEFNEDPDFNDSFGLFYSTKSASADSWSSYTNIAKIPGTNSAVNIQNLQSNQDKWTQNGQLNCDDSICYEYWSEDYSQIAGFTNMFTAKISNIPEGGKVRVLFAICDISDGSYNSAVVIEAGSLKFEGVEPEPSPYVEPTVDTYTIPVESKDTVRVEANIENGKAEVQEITKKALDKIVKPKSGKKSKTKTIDINLSKAKQEVKEVELSLTSVENLAKVLSSKNNSVKSVVVKMTDATVELDAKTLTAVKDAAQGDSINLVVDKTEDYQLNNSQKETLSGYNVNKTFEAYFESKGQRIHDFNGGKAVVGIKFTPEKSKNAKNYRVYYVDENGGLQKYATKYVKGQLKFATTHFSDYAIVYDTFKEVLLLQAKASGSKNVNLKWNDLSNTNKYVVYGAKCGEKFKKLATVKGNAFAVKKIDGKALDAHTAYKFYVVAYDVVGNKIKSKSVHFVTTNTIGTMANAKAVKADYDELLLSVGVTQNLGAKYSMPSGKKHLGKGHGAALRYISEDTGVATVSKTGVVKAVGKGTANIYAQDIGGTYSVTKVTVE